MDLGIDAQVLRYLLRVVGCNDNASDADVKRQKVVEVLDRKEYIARSYDDYDLYP